MSSPELIFFSTACCVTREMGSTLAPVIANFNMSFEKQAMSLVAKKPGHICHLDAWKG
jgi:hypothetical protein